MLINDILKTIILNLLRNYFLLQFPDFGQISQKFFGLALAKPQKLFEKLCLKI